MLTWDLVVVRADTMKLRISIEEHAELQKRIRAVLNTWNHGTRREGSLIDISVIILGILVNVEFAELLELHHHKQQRQHRFNDNEDYDRTVVEPQFSDTTVHCRAICIRKEEKMS